MWLLQSSNYSIQGNLTMKEGSLFCFAVMRSIKLGCFRSCSWKALNKEGCMGLVPWHLDLQCKSFWILNFFSLEIKLNHSWTFWTNWNVPLMLLERCWWIGFNGICLVRFGFKMWDMVIFSSTFVPFLMKNNLCY